MPQRDPVTWMKQEYSDLVLTVRKHASRISKHDRIRAGSGATAPEQLTANGMLSNLRAQVKLSSSGNTLTLSPTDNGIVPLYGDSDQGWVNTYLLSAVTLNTTGYTPNSMYDIFAYYDQVTSDPPAPALEAAIWSSETARSVALTTQDGVSLKSTDTTRRYLTTGRYNGSTMLVPTDNTNKETFWGTGDPRNNGSDPATGVGIFAGGVSLSSVVYMFFTILNGTVGFGVDLLGNLRAIAGGFKLNNSEMSLTIGGNMVMQITAAYALFGSNVSAANTTAFSIFFTAQTYNSESMEAGSVLFGSNSSGYANVYWIPSLKRLQFRNGTSVQAYVNTDGAITAAAGKVKVNSQGIIMVGDTWPSTSRLYFVADDNNALVLGQLIGTYGGAAVNSGIVLYGRAHDSGVRGFVYLGAQDDTGSNKGTLVIDSNGSATFDFTQTSGALGAQSVDISTKTTGTNALNNTLYLDTDTNGTPAAGLGSAIAFRTRDSGGNMQAIGYVGVPYITTTNGSEDSKFLAGMMRKGVSFGVPAAGNFENDTANVGNVTTGETDLQTTTLIAGLFAENGDKVTADYAGTTVAHATATRRIRVYFGGTVIYDTTALTTTSASNWVIRVVCVRSSSTAVKCSVTFLATNYAGVVANYQAVTGLTLTNTQIIKITGQAGAAGAATNDIICTFGSVDFYPTA